MRLTFFPPKHCSPQHLYFFEVPKLISWHPLFGLGEISLGVFKSHSDVLKAPRPGKVHLLGRETDNVKLVTFTHRTNYI